MPTQRAVRTTLADLPRVIAAEGIRPPAVWLVGAVVGLNRPHDVPPPDDEDLD